MFNVWLLLTIVALLFVLSAPVPMTSDVVDTCTHAMLALITTLPVGELTVIPAPGVLFTDNTADSVLALNNCVKLFCTFRKAVLIASAEGSSGKDPGFIFCWLMLYTYL